MHSARRESRIDVRAVHFLVRVERWRLCGWFVNGAHGRAITPLKVISEVKRSVFLFDLKKLNQWTLLHHNFPQSY